MKVRLVISTLLTFLLIFALNLDGLAQKSKKEKNKKKYVVTDLDRTQAEKYFIEGEKYFILEDYAKAYVFFQRSLEIQPDNGASHYKIAQILVKGQDYDKALANALQAIDIDPQNKYYYLITTDIYTKQSNFKEAAKVLEDMISTLPGNEFYILDLANLYIFLEDYEKSLETYDRAESYFGVSENISFQKQKIYLKLNKLDLAVKEIEKLLASQPGNAQYINTLANMLITNGKSEEALPYLEEFLNDYPQNPNLRLVLYNIYETIGETEKANQNLFIAFRAPTLPPESKVQIFLSIVEQLPNQRLQQQLEDLAKILIEADTTNALIFAAIGDFYFKIDQKDKARNNYLLSANIDGSNFRVWQNILSLELDLQDYKSVVQHANQALEYFPNQGIIYYLQGFAYLNEKNYRESVNALEQSKKLSASNPDLVSNINAQLGDSYNSLKEYEKSDASYEEALKYNADFDHVLNNYSYFLSLRRKNLDKAKKMSTKLVKRNPDNSTFLDTYAWVLYMLGEYKEAKKYLEKALEGDISGVVMEHYGDILFKLGDIDGAVKYWEKAKGLDDTLELIDKKIADRKLYE